MKILLTVQDDHIAPRFDQTTEIIIADYEDGKQQREPRTIILPHKSAEELTDLIVKENIGCVICGGIEDTYYDFFIWKKIIVYDAVIGSYSKALDLAIRGKLQPGSILADVGSFRDAS